MPNIIDRPRVESPAGTRRVVLLGGEAFLRGRLAEFRHVGATVSVHDDPLFALAELAAHPDALMIVAASGESGDITRAVGVASVTASVPVVVGVVPGADPERVAEARDAGASVMVALPLTPDRVKDLLRAAAMLTAPGRERQHFLGGELVFDEQVLDVVWRGTPLRLAPREYATLLALACAYPHVASLDVLSAGLRADGRDPYASVRVGIRRIRRALATASRDASLDIETVRRRGYRLVN